MRTLVLLSLAACAAQPRAAAPSGDDAPPPDAPVDGAGDDAKPDAAMPVAPCTTAPWSIQTIDRYMPVDGAVAPLQPYIRSGATGLEVAYATNPSAGEHRRLAVRSPAGTWTFATEGTRVCGTVARGVDSHGLETECSADGPAVVHSSSEVVFGCGWRTGGGAWTTAMLAANTTLVQPALVIDHADRVHVTYDVAATTDYYAWRDPGGSWNVEAFTDHAAQYSPLAVDAAGCVHVARAIHDGGVPAYAVTHGVRCPGETAWTWETVIRENAFHWMGAHALAFDALGRLHLVFLGRSTGVGVADDALVHAVRAPTGAWTLGVADGALDPVVGSEAIAPDRRGGVWIGYYPKLAGYDTQFQADKVVLHVAADGTTERHSFGPGLYGGSVVPFVDPSGQVHVLIDSGWKQLEYATMCPEATVR